MAVKPGYKQTEVGVIPEEWGVVAVHQMGEVVTGKALAIHAPGKQRPYLRTKNVFDGWIDIDDVLTMPMTDEQFAHFQVRRGDVLLNEGQSLELVGRCSLYLDEYSEPCAMQNQLLRFRARKGVCSVFASYLFRYFQQTGVFARIALQTTSIAHLGGSRFEQLRLAWPHTEGEQHAIAEALSDADALIGALERLIVKKRQIKQGAMQELLRPKDGWIATKLGALGAFYKGSGIRKDKIQNGGLPCVRYGEIYTQHNDYIKTFYSWISSAVATTARRLKTGDVLFAGSGETKEEIGKCVAFVGDVEAYAGGDIVILRPEKANSMFLGYYLNTVPISRQKASKGQGDAVVHISSAALGDVDLMLPPDEEQTAIAAALGDMDAEIAALEEKLAKARQLKQGMMQELLTGRIRLI